MWAHTRCSRLRNGQFGWELFRRRAGDQVVPGGLSYLTVRLNRFARLKFNDCLADQGSKIPVHSERGVEIQAQVEEHLQVLCTVALILQPERREGDLRVAKRVCRPILCPVPAHSEAQMGPGVGALVLKCAV